MNYIYPAVFYPEDDGKYSVIFPDLNDLATYGDNLADAFAMAQEACGQYLFTSLRDGDVLPAPTPLDAVEKDEDAAGQQEDAEDGGTASNDAETTNPPYEPETGENGANPEPQEAEDEPEDKVIIPQGKMKVTVICDGSLNIRRSAAWGNENICGRAIRGQSYYVKEIHVVDGKKMVRTIGDLYLSGESEHVQFEQL